ncbi:hypothetical protein SEA_MARKY_75 [Streptomyces phage Marky]|nr:hypothetical protein SEA_MARKY_75 [Streptomyces phage Marky]
MRRDLMARRLVDALAALTGFTPAVLRSQPDEETIYCSNCGGGNPKGATYCAGCGKMLNP